MSKKHQLVEVTWIDIYGTSDGWTDLEQWTDPGEAVATTVGYLLPGLKEGYTVLAGSYLSLAGESWHDISYIPDVVVKSIRKLSRSEVL